MPEESSKRVCSGEGGNRRRAECERVVAVIVVCRSNTSCFGLRDQHPTLSGRPLARSLVRSFGCLAVCSPRWLVARLVGGLARWSRNFAAYCLHISRAVRELELFGWLLLHSDCFSLSLSLFLSLSVHIAVSLRSAKRYRTKQNYFKPSSGRVTVRAERISFTDLHLLGDKSACQTPNWTVRIRVVSNAGLQTSNLFSIYIFFVL